MPCAAQLAGEHINLARLCYLSGGDLAQAHALPDESFTLYRELGDKESSAYCLYLSGLLTLSEGDTASAHSQVEQAVALFKEMRQQHGTTVSLYALAQVVTAQGNDARSQALYEEGIAVARKAGDRRNIASAWKVWRAWSQHRESWHGRRGYGVRQSLCAKLLVHRYRLLSVLPMSPRSPPLALNLEKSPLPPCLPRAA
jgi:tetratricopeptide (TPR) repeat protein